MAELADAHGSGPCGSDTMRVQVPLSASHGGDRKVAAFVVSEKYNTKPGKGRKPWQLIEETKRRQTGIESTQGLVQTGSVGHRIPDLTEKRFFFRLSFVRSFKGGDQSRDAAAGRESDNASFSDV